MIRITLYKNCILNETYKNVVSTGKINGQNLSILDKYLSTLNKLVIPDIDFVYQKNEGDLIFDYEINNGDIYEYNYMKVECFTDDEESTLYLVRYCFINDIKLNNECVILNYKEDIWSNYSNKITGFENSCISNSRVTNFAPAGGKSFTVKCLPIEYTGNQPLELEKDSNVNENEMCIIMQLQTFKLDTATNITKRDTDFYILSYKNVKIENYTPPILSDYIHNVEQWLPYLKQLIRFQAGGIVELKTNPVEFTSYEVGKIYIIPKAYIPDALILGSQNPVMYFDEYSEDFTQDYYIEFNKFRDNDIETFLSYDKVFQPDYKNKMIGTVSTQVPIINNGMQFRLKISIDKKIDAFGIYMNVQNNIVDITKDFEYQPSVLSISSAQQAQKVIGTEIAVTNSVVQFISKQFSIASKMIKSAGGGDKASMIGGAVGAIGEEIKASFDLGLSLKGVLAPVYDTNYASFNNTNNFANIKKGVCIFKMVADNSLFTINCINEIGYQVFDYINYDTDIQLNSPTFFNDNNINYNTLKLISSNVYGNFTREIAKKINEMFENGIKIWYKETLELNDNLIVG